MRILLLGGTSEARALAARLHQDVEVISSLAGRVPDPALPVGEVRIGGFRVVNHFLAPILQLRRQCAVAFLEEWPGEEAAVGHQSP